MFNFGECEVIGIEKTGCTAGHLQACLHEKGKCEPIDYDYFGKKVSRGTVVLHTKNGDFTLKFKEESGWAKYLEIL